MYKKSIRNLIKILFISLVVILNIYCVKRSVDVAILIKNYCRDRECFVKGSPYTKLRNRGDTYYYAHVVGDGFNTEISLSHHSYMSVGNGSRFVIDIDPRYLYNPKGFKDGIAASNWMVLSVFVWTELIFLLAYGISMFWTWLSDES